MSAQNCFHEPMGAFTGEISAEMLKSVGVRYCIIGHSERRDIFHEGARDLSAKVDSCLSIEVVPIFCVGEHIEERKDGKQFDVVKAQIEEGLFHLEEEAIKKVVVAYEPVWAIGTGETATKEQAQEMHAYIRGLVKEKYGAGVAENLKILYGGSVKPENSKELFDCPDVDGGLVGGASLKVNSFMGIIKSV